MHRTEGADNVANLFKNGPPGTIVEENWLNAVQEEIANVIETAGITLKTASTETRDQLMAAILTLVDSSFASLIPRGYIDGLILSNGIDSDHDIDVAVGKCTDSGTALQMISLSTEITKRIDAVWAEGTNQGGLALALGAVANDTWYNVFVIMSLDETKVDVGFDTSLTAANLLACATDYSLYRRIGSVLTDGAANIIGFIQRGDWFLWKSTAEDISAGLNVGARTLFTLSTPIGIACLALFNTTIGNAAGTANVFFTSPDVDDDASNEATGRSHVPNIVSIGETSKGAGGILIWTDINSQIGAACDTNNLTTFVIGLTGYMDLRGKNS